MGRDVRSDLEKMLRDEREIEAAARDIARDEAGFSDIRDSRERSRYENERAAELVRKYGKR